MFLVRFNQNILVLHILAFAMAALLNSKEKPLKRTGNNTAPKISSMTLEFFTNIHGTVGGFEMKDGCVASLISSNQLVERQDNDKTVQWLGELISTNKKPAWASDYQATIPEDARVEYLWPSAVNNLSAYTRELNGELQQIPGGWVWLALAPNKQSLRGCVDALVQKAMRVQGETDSDIFFQSEPGSNILLRNITTR